jgi:4-amino-4-deoxy-L-arabinose transferase-like glycosyltransferase
VAAVLLIIWGAIYAFRLDSAPPSLAHDEVWFSIHADSIANRGADTTGARWPLYFRQPHDLWGQPLIVYWTAVFVKLLSLSEVSTRLPSVLIALAGAGIVFPTVREMSRSTAVAIAAMLMLLATPAYLIFARLGIDPIYPLPFTFAWLFWMRRYLAEGRTSQLVAAGVSLGLGFYTYIGAVVMMPVFFGLTVLVILLSRPFRPSHLAAAIASFAACLLPAAIWWSTHPGALGAYTQHYGVSSSLQLNPLQSLLEFFNYTALSDRVATYFDYFNPGPMFFSGSASLLTSTRTAGVFSFATAIALAIGVWRIFESRDRFGALVCAGLLLSPVAATLGGPAFLTDRILISVPFVTLAAAYGLAWLWDAKVRVERSTALTMLAAIVIGIGAVYCGWSVVSRGRVSTAALAMMTAGAAAIGMMRLLEARGSLRPVAVVVVTLALAQFSWFFRDYATDYRARSAGWFENNTRGAFGAAINALAESPGGTVFVTESIPWVQQYWRYYTASMGRRELTARLQTALPEQIAAKVGSAIVVARPAELKMDVAAAVHEGRTTLIKDADGSVSFVMIRP